MCRDLNVDDLSNLVIDCLRNYHQHIKNFQSFRERVKNEVNLYLRDLKNLLATIDFLD